MTGIFNNPSPTGRVFKWQVPNPVAPFGIVDKVRLTPNKVCSFILNTKNNSSANFRNKRFFNDNNWDIAEQPFDILDNLATLNGRFFVGKNGDVYMKMIIRCKQIYLKISNKATKLLKNSGFMKNALKFAERDKSGLINAINFIFNKPILNPTLTKPLSNAKIEPFTVGDAIPYILLAFETRKIGNYLFDYQGHNHTKDGVDLISELVSFFGPVGIAYSITYSMIDRHYPGGISGYANDIKDFSIDIVKGIPYALEYYGFTEYGKNTRNNNVYVW